MGPGMRDIRHDIRHVDHLVALENAEPEIVEVQNFHY